MEITKKIFLPSSKKFKLRKDDGNYKKASNQPVIFLIFSAIFISRNGQEVIIIPSLPLNNFLYVTYQSVPSLTIPRGIFLKGRIPHPSGIKKVRNPDPWDREIVLKPHARGNYF